MKKTLSLLLAASLTLSMAACAATPAAPAASASKEVGPAVQVDENLLTVDITLGSIFFQDKTPEEIADEAKSEGYKDCKVHEDGSVTYTMTKKMHAEKLEERKAGLGDTVAACLEGESAVESFVDIQYTDDFSKIDVFVDEAKYSAWDNLYALTFYIAGAYYQAFAGVASDEIDVVVNFINNETKAVINTSSYKKFVGEVEEETEQTEQTASDTAATALAEKETVTVENVCEFFVESTDITDDVIPPQKSSFYTHYEAEDGKVYVDLCVAYKNLGSSDCGADKLMQTKLLYGGKYEYSGFSIIEKDSRGDFTYTNITNIAPLTTEYLHYLFEVPAEVKDSDGALEILLSVEGKEYAVTVREGKEGEVDSLNEKAVAKNEGAVSAEQIIAVKDTCEFFVEYAKFTDDVVPPKPDSFYTHYEAEEGKSYVDLCIAYKNWKTKAVGADDVITAKLTYTNRYEYSGFSIIEKDSRSDFTYTNITDIAPLTTEYLHYLFEVPAEVAKGPGAVDIAFSIGGHAYSYKVR